MDTHSVPLDGYDLSTLSSLSTERGVVVTPVKWESPRGGHHRRGTLTFPQTQSDGAQVIDSATKYVELTIRTIDGVAERKFRWDL